MEDTTKKVLTIAGLGAVAALGLRWIVPKAQRGFTGLGASTKVCLINSLTGKIVSVHKTFAEAVKAENKKPMATHYLQDCEPGWKKGMSVNPGYDPGRFFR